MTMANTLTITIEGSDETIMLEVPQEGASLEDVLRKGRSDGKISVEFVDMNDVGWMPIRINDLVEENYWSLHYQINDSLDGRNFSIWVTPGAKIHFYSVRPTEVWT